MLTLTLLSLTLCSVPISYSLILFHSTICQPGLKVMGFTLDFLAVFGLIAEVASTVFCFPEYSPLYEKIKIMRKV